MVRIQKSGKFVEMSCLCCKFFCPKCDYRGAGGVPEMVDCKVNYGLEGIFPSRALVRFLCVCVFVDFWFLLQAGNHHSNSQTFMSISCNLAYSGRSSTFTNWRSNMESTINWRYHILIILNLTSRPKTHTMDKSF